MEAQFPGMDYDFLRYMGVFLENQRRIQGHYLPYFEKCTRVVDLACGDADFVELLVEKGVDVVGVDSDDKAYAATVTKGLPVVKQDVFEWLAEQPDASFDGVFSAHLIEHLPYPKVIELIEQSYRILQPGGIIVLATPNARSLFSHLEMFYTHFGHVTFYHPRLVNFFLDRSGFVDLHEGENPETASPLLFNLRQFLAAPPPPSIEAENAAHLPNLPIPNMSEDFAESPVIPQLSVPGVRDSIRAESVIAYRSEVPLQGRTPFHYLSYWLKRMLTRWLVQPLMDSLVQNLREQLVRQNTQQGLEFSSQLDRQHQALVDAHRLIRVGQQHIQELSVLLRQEQAIRRSQRSSMENTTQELYRQLQIFGMDIQTLNGPFESYSWAYKPETVNEANTEQV